MSTMNRSNRFRPVFAAAVALAMAGPAAAQYYPNPYGPYPAWGGGVGGALAGQAQVIQANGQLAINNEQARIEREKYNQEKLNTRKQAFDLAAYEKANTPPAVELAEKTLGRQIRRVLSLANPAEIKRGDTLNTLMPYIQSLSDQGCVGPPTPISPAMLQSVNVKAGSAGGAPGAGLLKDVGKMGWPLVLRGPKQKELDKMLPKAVSEAAAGTLDLTTYNKLVSAVDSIRQDLRKQYHQEKISGSMFLGGQSFLDSLSDSLKVLQRPDAARFFNGSYAAHGHNVPELVNNMMDQGLTFAPATPGEDASYFALHNAFVSYVRSAQSGVAYQAPMPKVGQKGVQ
jgi:hypothetical protein